MNTIRKNLTLLAMGVCAAFALTSAHAATLAGVPMKDHHAKLMQTCETCHGTATPTERPDGKACIGCHGTMDKIPTKPNRFDKFPHASAHYGNTLDCTTCHAEHKASRALCNDCHVVEWTNCK